MPSTEFSLKKFIELQLTIFFTAFSLLVFFVTGHSQIAKNLSSEDVIAYGLRLVYLLAFGASVYGLIRLGVFACSYSRSKKSVGEADPWHEESQNKYQTLLLSQFVTIVSVALFAIAFFSGAWAEGITIMPGMVPNPPELSTSARLATFLIIACPWVLLIGASVYAIEFFKIIRSRKPRWPNLPPEDPPPGN